MKTLRENMELNFFYKVDDGGMEYGDQIVKDLQEAFDVAKKTFETNERLDFVNIDAEDIPYPFDMPDFFEESLREDFYDLMDYRTVEKTCNTHGLYWLIEEGRLNIMKGSSDGEHNYVLEKAKLIDEQLKLERKRLDTLITNIETHLKPVE